MFIKKPISSSLIASFKKLPAFNVVPFNNRALNLVMNKAAKEENEAFFKEVNLIKRNNRGEIYSPIANRMYENFIKIAIIDHAMMGRDHKTEMQKDSMIFARKTIEATFKFTKSFTSDYVAENATEKFQNKLIVVLKELGGVATKTEIGEKTRYLTVAERDRILANLIETGLVNKFKCSKGTKRITYAIL